MSLVFSFFFFNDTATTEIYTLSLHDALPISQLADFTEAGLARGSTRQHREDRHLVDQGRHFGRRDFGPAECGCGGARDQIGHRLTAFVPQVYALHVRPHPLERSEEHTSELQSRLHLVCRLLLEKKKKNNTTG